MFSRCLADVFSVTFFRLPRRLEDALKMSLRDLQICLQDVCNTSPSRLCKTSSRRLGYLRRQKWLRWRCVADVFKTYLENDCKTSWRQTNKCFLAMLIWMFLDQRNKIKRSCSSPWMNLVFTVYSFYKSQGFF